MKFKLIQTTLIVLLCLSLTTSVRPEQINTDNEIQPDAIGTCPSDPLACVSSGPIKINGNDELKYQAALMGWDLGGSQDGSKGFPFQISGYIISGVTTIPISISNVDLYLTISSNYIDGSNQTYSGIYLDHVNHTSITSNYITNMIRDESTVSYGIRMEFSHHNTILRNDIWGDYSDYRFHSGIMFYDSWYNRIVLNNVTNFYNGIVLAAGSNRNHITLNTVSFALNIGIYASYDSDHNSIYDNVIDNNNVGIIIHGAFYNRINNNQFSANNYAIHFYDTKGYNSATNNTIRDSLISGILIENSNNTSVQSNTIINSISGFGIEIISGWYASVIWNNFINNYQQVNDNADATYISNNYFSDWWSPDDDYDGFVDMPYMIQGTAYNYDYMPLTRYYYLTEFEVTYPFAFEQVSEMAYIEWIPAVDTYGTTFNYSIYYSSDRGFLWTNIANNVQGSSYLWDFSELPNGDRYVIMIVCRGENGVAMSRYSYRTFTIENRALTIPKITFPMPGDTHGAPDAIRWEAAIDNWGFDVYYTIYYSEDGIVWNMIETNIGPNVDYYYWDSSTLLDEQYLLKIVAYSDDETSEYVMEGYFSTINHGLPPIDQLIKVEAYPTGTTGGFSYVGETANFEVKIESTFLHDMPDVKLIVELSGTHDLIIHEAQIYLSKQSVQTQAIEYIFLKEGLYSISAKIIDDVGVEWSYVFDWEVKAIDTITSDPTGETTSDTNDTDNVSTPELSLPISPIPYIVTLSIMAVFQLKKRKY